MHTLYFAESMDLANLDGASGFEFEMWVTSNILVIIH